MVSLCPNSCRCTQLTFEALNAENRKVSTRLGITIDILDANDNPPKFDHEMYQITVNESTLQGKSLEDLCFQMSC